MKRRASLERLILATLVLALFSGAALLILTQRGAAELTEKPPAPRAALVAARQEERIDAFAKVRRCYTLTLPKRVDAGLQLAFFARHQYSEILIDGERRFAVQPDIHAGVLKTPGNYWALVGLREEDAGKRVQIVLTPAYRNSAEPEFLLTPKEYAFKEQLRGDLHLGILAFLTVITGLLLVLLVLCVPFERRRRRALSYLALLAISAGIWKLLGLPTTYLVLDWWGDRFFHYATMPYLTGMVAYLVMPVLAVQFLNHLREGGPELAGQLGALIAALTAMLLLVLQMFGLAELHDFLPAVSVMNSALLALALTDILRCRSNQFQLWLASFPVSVALDLLIAGVTRSSRYAVVLLFCILINALVHGVLFVRAALREETEVQKLRLTALAAQIQPHFIQNTLTSVYYLCDSNPQKAKQAIRDLSQCLENDFQAATEDTPIPFERELAHTKAYLAVEQLRFEDELIVEYDVSETMFRLPPLTLQPIVESAVKRGLGTGAAPERILIRTRKQPGGFELTVEDDAPSAREAGSGLQSVGTRLRLLNCGALRVGARADGGAIVTIFVPEKS